MEDHPTWLKRNKSYFLTGLRALACLALVLAFAWNTWPIRIGIVGVAALATLTSLLLAYELAIRQVQIEWIAATIGATICAAGVAYLVWQVVGPPEPTGPLRAGNERTPRTSCAIALSSGTKILVALEHPRSGEANAFRLLTVDGCPILQFTEISNGLAVNATFYDRGNDIAFQLVGNSYEPAMDLRLKEYRPDPNTLAIFDHLGREVFYLRYLNPNAVLVRGTYLEENAHRTD